MSITSKAATNEQTEKKAVSSKRWKKEDLIKDGLKAAGFVVAAVAGGFLHSAGQSLFRSVTRPRLVGNVLDIGKKISNS